MRSRFKPSQDALHLILRLSDIIERLWKFFRREVVNNPYYSSFAEFTEQSLFFFFECLAKHAHRLKSLLTLNFQLFNKRADSWVAYAG